MEEIIQFLAGILNREFIRAVFSNPRVKDNVVKAKLRPMEQKGELLFQLESFTKTQAFHKNLTVEETKNELAKLLEEFRQVQVETVIEDITVLISKKGKATIKRKRRQKLRICLITGRKNIFWKKGLWFRFFRILEL